MKKKLYIILTIVLDYTKIEKIIKIFKKKTNSYIV